MPAFPPPPVPKMLEEFLADYPEVIAEIGESLKRYAEKPSILMPFDGAIWTIQAALEGMALDARDAATLAKEQGDDSAAESALAKELRLLHAGIGLVGRLGGLREHIAEVWGVTP